jgi:D-tyrosyl-tRNA(Tyr) deacylase
MRIVLQRVTWASVTVQGRITGAIALGLVALVGITHGDTAEQAALLAKKTAHLRIFADDDDKMNRSVLDVGGGVLVVSQFTLFADTRRGRRPSFVESAPPDRAAPLVEAYIAALHREGVQQVEQGVFGAMMQVAIHNDGPVTIILDTRDYA